MTSRLQRSLPFLKVLLNSPINSRRAILQKFPRFVIDDIAEILYNIVLGNVKLRGKLRVVIHKYKIPLLKLVQVARNKKLRRQLLNYKQQQGGGIFATSAILLPLIISLVGKIIGRGHNAV